MPKLPAKFSSGVLWKSQWNKIKDGSLINTHIDQYSWLPARNADQNTGPTLSVEQMPHLGQNVCWHWDILVRTAPTGYRLSQEMWMYDSIIPGLMSVNTRQFCCISLITSGLLLKAILLTKYYMYLSNFMLNFGWDLILGEN